MFRLALSSRLNSYFPKFSWNRNVLSNLQQLKKFSGQETFSNDATLVGRHFIGIVKWYNLVRGFGAITVPEAGLIFIHKSSIQKYNGLPSLMEDEPVEFDVGYYEKKKILQALNVTGPNGSPVIGQRFSNDMTLIGRHLTGIIQWYHVHRGFGGITLTESETIFFHRRFIKGDKVLAMDVGQQVEFDVGYDEETKRLNALNVTGPNGAPVIGQRFSNDVTLIGRHLTGTIKWYYPRRRLGGIALTETEIISLHFNHIKGDEWRTLDVGQQVEFDVGHNQKKNRLRALNVTGLNGAQAVDSKGKSTPAIATSASAPTESTNQ